MKLEAEGDRRREHRYHEAGCERTGLEQSFTAGHYPERRDRDRCDDHGQCEPLEAVEAAPSSAAQQDVARPADRSDKREGHTDPIEVMRRSAEQDDTDYGQHDIPPLSSRSRQCGRQSERAEQFDRHRDSER